MQHQRAWIIISLGPGTLDVELVSTKSEVIFIWAAVHCSGDHFQRVSASLSIGLDPIKPCTLIFPMGFGALIQIGWINTVQRVANTCKLKHDHDVKGR